MHVHAHAHAHVAMHVHVHVHACAHPLKAQRCVKLIAASSLACPKISKRVAPLSLLGLGDGRVKRNTETGVSLSGPRPCGLCAGFFVGPEPVLFNLLLLLAGDLPLKRSLKGIYDLPVQGSSDVA